MFYVFNTETGKYVCDDIATAFRGKSVPKNFGSLYAAQREIERRDWLDHGTLTIHTTIFEEALDTYE